jgi:UDP-N-acetylglucosamine 4,6-dehydratase
MSRKHYLIIGGTGSLGTTLLDELSHTNKITVVSRDENKQWAMRQKFPQVEFILGDMRDAESMREIISQGEFDIVIIAAALKHIDQCEAMPSECIKTNVVGVKNVIDACEFAKFSGTVVFISTDKACLPINTYGCSKALAEKIVIHAGQTSKTARYLVVRYGNVILSRGSIIPKLLELCKNPATKFLPLTDPEMTRFFMTLPEAVRLINTAIEKGTSGDIWIPKVVSYKISDLFNWFSEKFLIPVEVVGCRPGEKLHEILISQSEAVKTLSVKFGEHLYYVIRGNKPQKFQALVGDYSSETSSGGDFDKILSKYTS